SANRPMRQPTNYHEYQTVSDLPLRHAEVPPEIGGADPSEDPPQLPPAGSDSSQPRPSAPVAQEQQHEQRRQREDEEGLLPPQQGTRVHQADGGQPAGRRGTNIAEDGEARRNDERLE